MEAKKETKKKFREPRKKAYDEEVIDIRRVTKVTKGGRNFRFSAVVAAGDRKGKIGLGTGKANEVPEAISKATNNAIKNMVKISLVENRTIPHEITATQTGSKVLLKPAFKGTGVKAGGAVRAVLELAGVKDVLTKSLGSSSKINVAHATFTALKQQRTVEEVAKIRGKQVEDLL